MCTHLPCFDECLDGMLIAFDCVNLPGLRGRIFLVEPMPNDGSMMPTTFELRMCVRLCGDEVSNRFGSIHQGPYLRRICNCHGVFGR